MFMNGTTCMLSKLLSTFALVLYFLMIIRLCIVWMRILDV